MANKFHISLANRIRLIFHSWAHEISRFLHVALLKWGGVPIWNFCRLFLIGSPNLHAADLAGLNLRKVNLRYARLNFANLESAQLAGAELQFANLSSANLTKANFDRALLSHTSFSNPLFVFEKDGRRIAQDQHLRGACLSHASFRNVQAGHVNFQYADLSYAKFNDSLLLACNLSNAILQETDLTGAQIFANVFSDTNLSTVAGLEECLHLGPSSVDYHTLRRSTNVPLKFWRGCGLPDQIIEYMPSLSGQAIEFYSCFISYSSKDQEFAARLHADLQDNGVRCWFAPHDLVIGGFIQEHIDRQIRLHDKVILILSEASVASAWVRREVKMAIEEEKEGRHVLFPIRLDNAVLDTTDQWAHDIKRTRNIGDFTKWKEYGAYRTTFDSVLRDLKAKR